MTIGETCSCGFIARRPRQSDRTSEIRRTAGRRLSDAVSSVLLVTLGNLFACRTKNLRRRRRAGLYLLWVVTAAMVVVAPAVAARVAPGQRLVNYVVAHAKTSDRAKVSGLSLEGGRVRVVDGQSVVRGVTAVVRTRLPDTKAATLVAQRLCAVASVGQRRLRLQQVAAVEVRSRTGTVEADSVAIGLPACHRWTITAGSASP